MAFKVLHHSHSDTLIFWFQSNVRVGIIRIAYTGFVSDKQDKLACFLCDVDFGLRYSLRENTLRSPNIPLQYSLFRSFTHGIRSRRYQTTVFFSLEEIFAECLPSAKFIL